MYVLRGVKWVDRCPNDSMQWERPFCRGVYLLRFGRALGGPSIVLVVMRVGFQPVVN